MNSKKGLIFWLLAILSLVLIVIYFKTPVSNDSQLELDKVSQTDWVEGNRQAKLILVEYSDFQCPACGRYYPILKQLNQEMGDQVLIVYRHFPLSQSHPWAQLAAQAAEAAGQQGQFWPMHDLLFSNQQQWSTNKKAKKTFFAYGEKLGLDMDKFKEDLSSKKVKDKIKNDYLSGLRAGVKGTPSMFLQGKLIRNPASYEELKQIVEAMLKDSQQK